MGTMLHSCVEVREPIDLSFGAESGVGRGMGVVNGVDVMQGKSGRGVSGVFSPISMNGTLFSGNV